MILFHFKDKIDGRYAAISAKTKQDAIDLMKAETGLPFFVFKTEVKDGAINDKAVFIYNKILPF